MNREQEYFKSTIAIWMLQVVLFLGTVQLFTEIYAPSAKPQITRYRSRMTELRKARKNKQSYLDFVEAIQR